MALAYALGNYNFALISGTGDKFADLWIKKVIPRLVATGRFMIVGSGSGAGALFQRKGQTAGLGGADPWNVLTGAVSAGTTNWDTGASTSSFSRTSAWVDVAELDGAGNETGRGFTIQRNQTSLSNTTSSGVLGCRLAAFTGTASATSPGTTPSVHAFFTGGSAYNGAPSVAWLQDQNVAGLDSATSADTWVQLGIESSVGAKNVCTFVLYVYNRTSGLPIAAMWYGEVDAAQSLESHPLFFASGSPSRVFGLVGSTTVGPYHAATGGRWFGGPTLAAASLGKIVAPTWNITGVPGSVFAPLRNSVDVVGFQPQVWTSAGQLGRAKYGWVNPYNRDYPSTQGVPGTSPKVYYGQTMIDWITAVAPGSSP
jgi:hypothetical protein